MRCLPERREKTRRQARVERTKAVGCCCLLSPQALLPHVYYSGALITFLFSIRQFSCWKKDLQPKSTVLILQFFCFRLAVRHRFQPGRLLAPFASFLLSLRAQRAIPPACLNPVPAE